MPWNTLSWLLYITLLLPSLYWFLLALASTRRPRPPDAPSIPRSRFLIAIPAHNEEGVLDATVHTLLQQNYPRDLYAIHVVADHCNDGSADVARKAGATVHELNGGPRRGKGAALAWLFDRALQADAWDAVVVFDADTRVERDFLSIMDAHLARGDEVIQGRHVISNPEAGRYAALTWAMFMVDNRFQNLGRANLGWAAKNMGDSICVQAGVLADMGWEEGLTDDYQLRQKLLLAGIRIAYAPAAVGRGQAAPTWASARRQRARWLQGSYQAGRLSARSLLLEGLRRRDLALLDGAAQAYLPAYSTLTLLCIALLALQFAADRLAGSLFSPALLTAWSALAGLLFLYPFFGLALERAPLRAYAAMLTGPVFIVWRTWLALRARLGPGTDEWVRTQRE